MSAVKVLIGLSVAWFVAMVCGSSVKSILLPSSQTLLNWGASSASETFVAGEYWRLLTCSFVHVGIFHLAINIYVLRDIGREVENAFGRSRFWIIYSVSAIGGALTSIFVNPLLISAGASGAIFGAFGAMLAIVWRRPESFPKGYLILHGKIILFLILYSIAFSFIDKNADNAAHVGGFIFGFLAGLCVVPNTTGIRGWRSKNLIALGSLITAVAGGCLAANLVLAHKPEIVSERFYRQAIDLLQDEKYSRALPLLDETILLNPENANALCDRARAHSELKQFEDAISDCNSALKLKTADKTAYTVRASVYQQTGDYQKSYDDLSKLIALEPKDAMAYNSRAWSAAALGQYEQSIVDCERSLQLKADSAATYDTRAVAYILMKDFDKAVQDLDHAISIKPKDGAFYYHRAIAKNKMQKTNSDAEDAAYAKKYGYTPEPWEPKL